MSTLDAGPAAAPSSPPPVAPAGPAAGPALARDRRDVAADVHGHPRQPGDDQRAAGHPGRPRLVGRPAVVVHERLHADASRPSCSRRPRSVDRLGRRRVMLAGISALHPRLDRLRAEHDLRGADRGPRGPGPRRRGDHAALAHPAGRGRPAGRCGRPRSASGAASPVSASRSARSSAARSSRASAGRPSSGSTSRWRSSPCPLLLLAVAESRGAWQRLDLRRRGAARRRGVPRHLGDRARQRRRLDLRRCVLGRLVARRAAGPGVRRAGPAGRAHAVLPLRLFRSRGFSVANVIGLSFTHRHVRHGVPARAVPADRPGLHAARGGPAHAAVDRRPDGRRPDRRGDRRPRPACGPCWSPAWCCRPARWCGSPR